MSKKEMKESLYTARNLLDRVRADLLDMPTTVRNVGSLTQAFSSLNQSVKHAADAIDFLKDVKE